MVRVVCGGALCNGRGGKGDIDDEVVSSEKTHDLPEGSLCCFPHSCYTVKIGGVNLLVLFVQCQPGDPGLCACLGKLSTTKLWSHGCL